MKNFSYHNPTRIEFGKGKEENIGEYISESGVSKVLIVYGSERIKHSGLFNKVAQSLTDKGIHFEELGGVQSNPLLSKVYEGIEIAKAKKLEAVLAVGGGSVLDSSKAIAAGATYEGDVWDFFTYKAVPEKALKIFDIMTLAATGSEMNNFAVVTKDETKEKFSLAGPATYPTVSVINPELQATVGNDYLAYSASDIFAHSLDMYLSATYLPEYIAGYVENILKTVMRTTEILLADKDNYEARSEFAWAATQALNFTTFCGIENNRYDTHFLEHTLSAEYNIAHGAGLSILMPAWMKWQKQFLPERFERFARVMFNKQDADAGIEALKNWYAKIGAPVTLSEGQIPEIDIPMLVDKLFAVAGMWGATQLYTKDMIRTVLQNAV
ncbi:MAG: iron-containing alcohol dehydrogenase [Bacteroides graminisolvens]|jgi:NADP-dependent alcohol dehydrogenase|uniref:iron-containing alcohol dehydrogenase n=1 Tax=uncultured Bacteroides sp. TaxID=162156 RepID=UPI00280A5E13|nr:iron-containing alcohol dehydrogenase [uncultured Bacteroides sp.]MCD8555845.1 iron-containing alcohol dehydrogenase [Bacteroides graminisolvens]